METEVSKVSPIGRSTYLVERNGVAVLFDKASMRAWANPTQADLGTVRGAVEPGPLNVPRSNERVWRTITPRIKLFRIVVVEGCDWDCSYCFEKLVAPKPRAMKQELLLDVIERIIQQSSGQDIAIHWFGGEPLLAFDLIGTGVAVFEEAAAAGRISGVSFEVTTHGGRVTEEIARYLFEHRFSVSLSLDGPKEINDRFRLDKKGKGTFDRAISGLQTLRRAGVDVGVLFTAHNETLDYLASSIQFAVSELKATTVGVNSPQPTTKGWDIDGAKLARQLAVASEYCRDKGVVLTGPNQKILRRLCDRSAPLSDCTAADGSMAVSVAPNGSLGYCIVSWNDILHASPEITERAVAKAIRWKAQQHLTDDCQSCIAETVCGGPCALEKQLCGLDKAGRCAFHITYLTDTLMSAAERR